MTTFLLIRHADTAAVDRYLAGTAPGTPLTAAGLDEARSLADALQHVELAAVVSSPLERARQTADPIADRHRLECLIVPELTEQEFGNWTGATLTELNARADWRQFNQLRSTTRAPSGELMLDVQYRAVTAVLSLHERFPTGRVAVVTHADVVRALLLFFLAMPLDLYWRLEIAPARISVLELDAGRPRVRQVNAAARCFEC